MSKGVLVEVSPVITLDDVDYKVDAATFEDFKKTCETGDWRRIQVFAESIRAQFERVETTEER